MTVCWFRGSQTNAFNRLSAFALAIALILGGWSALASAAPAEFDDGAIYQVRHPEWFKESFLDLRDDAEEAADAGKLGLFIFFSTQGCSYCHLFIEQSLNDPQIAARLKQSFDSFGLEIFSDAELTDFSGTRTRVKTFALDQGVQFAPTLLFYDTAGKRLLRLTGYYPPERFRQVLDYLIDGHVRRQSLSAYLAETATNAATADASAGLLPDALFSPPPYALDRSRLPAERPLLVLFEGADCTRCAHFHQTVLKDMPTRTRLSAFDLVRLDAGDAQTPVLTPDGARVTPRDWYRSLGFTELPALVFFDESGQALIATDALVLNSRMNNLIGYVTERAYERGWNYQRYARSQGQKRFQNASE